MMEDAGEVKFSCGYVETKAKLIVEINEDWRNSLKGGKLLIRNLIKPLEFRSGSHSKTHVIRVFFYIFSEAQNSS